MARGNSDPESWRASRDPLDTPRRARVTRERRGSSPVPDWRSFPEKFARLAEAKRSGELEDELERLGRIPLLVVDEVGCIPSDPEAANLMFSFDLLALRVRFD
jgi:hypothetical protein